MPEIKVLICGCCKVELKRQETKLKNKNGFSCEIIDSKGGWGNKRDVIKITDEFCDECYTKLLEATETFKKTYQSLLK